MILEVKDLHVNKEGVEILKGVNLDLDFGKVLALMGQNGSGKSTLAQVLMGNPLYEKKSGTVLYKKHDLFSKNPQERSNSGIFLAFQHPYEIPGLKVGSYLRLLYNNSHDENITFSQFRKKIADYIKLLGIKEDILQRYLNEGFSGGEKKRMEMLQMLILEPEFIILDEIDSGLDVDAIRHVAESIKYLQNAKSAAVLLITHYPRILKYIKPDKVCVMKDGEIVKEGNEELAREIEDKGYEKITL